MNRRDIVIGTLVLAVLALVIFWMRSSSNEPLPLPSPTPSVEEKIESSFKLDIPDDVEKAELSDVALVGGSGIATRKYESNRFSHTVLADLPDPEAGSFYQGWLVKKSADGKEEFISTGRLTVAKGGWMLNFESRIDYSPYGGVLLTSEKVFDKTPEKKILQGNF